MFKDKKKFDPVHIVLQTEEELCLMVKALSSIDTVHLPTINLVASLLTTLKAQVK